MGDELIPSSTVDLEAMAARYLEHVRDTSRSENTQRAYDTDWDQFTTWLDSVGGLPLDSEPAVVVALGTYIEAHAQTKTASTLSRRLAGIRAGLRDRGLPAPDPAPFQKRITAIERDQARGSGASPAISERALRQMVSLTPDTPRGTRDRAVLLVGFLGAMRRSEVEGLDLADIELHDDEGMVIQVRRAKTGRRTVFVPLTRHPETCAVRATQRYLEHRGHSPGPLFVSAHRGGLRPVEDRYRMQGRVVDQIVKRYSREAGLPEGYSAHSLRSGLATAAARRGADLRAVMAQTGHKSMTQAEAYVQIGQGFQDNPVNLLSDL